MRTNEHWSVSDPRSELAGQLADPFLSEKLFDHLSDIVYFVKDQSARYVVANQTLVQRCGLVDKASLIGKTSAEVFGNPIGTRFYSQDMDVIQTGQALINELEQHAYSSLTTGWCLTTKLPLADRNGKTIGLVGLSRDLQSPGEDSSDLNRLAKTVDHIKANLDHPLRTADLCEMADMSPYQLDRRCREVYGMSPPQLVLQLRMSSAASLLRHTETAISSISLSVGYSDQSAFTRQFRRTFGLSPGKFRVQSIADHTTDDNSTDSLTTPN